MTGLRRLGKRVVHRWLGDDRYASLQARHWRSRLARLDYPYEFREEIAAAVAPGDTVIDVGANVGQYTALLADLVGPTGRVIAFEPVPRTFGILQSVVSGLGLGNVEPLAVALGEVDGTASMIDVRDADGLPDPGLSHLGSSTDGDAVDVSVARLDSLCEQIRLDACSFVKIDVEGAELLVLRGAVAFLATHRPTILVELDREMSARYGCSPTETTAFLERVGYERLDLRDDPSWSGPSRLFRYRGGEPGRFAASNAR